MRSVVLGASQLLIWLWNAAVDLMAEFVAAVLSHPKVQAATEQGIGRGMTQFIKSPAFREAMDDLASSMATDVGRHHETARQIGKDVPKLVGGFMGGLMSNVRHGGKGQKNEEFIQGPLSIEEEPKKIV